jgi:hypothetical protein
MIQEYTERQWEEEMKAPLILLPSGQVFPFGRALPCPQCKTIGFYGPRHSPSEGEIIRKYRACKFCGFWQEASGEVFDQKGGEPYRCIAVYCEKCRNNYDWRVPWAFEPGGCQKCHAELKRTVWASDDPKHPFRTLKDQIVSLLRNGSHNPRSYPE